HLGVQRVHPAAVVEELEVGLLGHRSFAAAEPNRPLRTRAVVGNAWTVWASVSIGVPSLIASTAAWMASPAPWAAMNAPMSDLRFRSTTIARWPLAASTM